MRIGVIQAYSQRDKNPVLFSGVREAVPPEYQVVNFGVNPGSTEEISYVTVAVCVCLLLGSGAVDFMVTGCSSGQGMMLACNSLPGVMCGYIKDSSDAFLFGRINGGNAVSYPLGLGWGWNGDLNFRDTMRALFSGGFGCGYPPQDAKRKRHDMQQVRMLNTSCRKPLTQALLDMDRPLLLSALRCSTVYEYIKENASDQKLAELLIQIAAQT